MKPKTTNFKFAALICRSLFAVTMFVGTTQAAPTEHSIQTLKRTASSDLSLQASLTKNQFRTETYQESYQVEVPYEVDEIYYEQVPYLDTETYYEQVPYQDTETYYVEVPYQEQEAYTDYEQRCESVRQCHQVPEEICGFEQQCRAVPEQQCRQERVCKPVPGQPRCQEVTECGTNAQGKEICKTRKVCENTPGTEECGYINKCETTTRQECHQERVCHTEYREQCNYENVCSQVPVTKYRTITKYRQEARTRSVTKYRDEARTRTVTKYREEERTRTVTKYRTETKCCVTKTREVFDHQDQVAVTVRFPQGSELLEQEAETFQVALSGATANLKVNLSFLSTILGYRIAGQSLEGAQATIDLELAAKYSAQDLGETNISAMDLLQTDAGAILILQDQGSKPRVRTGYSFQIRSKETNAIVGEGVGTNSGQEKVTMAIEASQLENDQAYLIDLRVQRSGIVLAETVDFVKTVEIRFGNLDPAVYGNADLIDPIRIEGVSAAAVLALGDHAPEHPELETSYHIKLERAATTSPGKRRLLLEKTLTREQLAMTAEGIGHISLKDLGLTNDKVSFFKKGRVVFATLTVVRKSPRLNQGEPLSIVQEKEIKMGN